MLRLIGIIAICFIVYHYFLSPQTKDIAAQGILDARHDAAELLNGAANIVAPR